VARVAPIKDYRTLVGAAKSVISRLPMTYFLIIGDTTGAGSYQRHFEEVRSMLSDAGILEHFVFTGFRNDVDRLLAAMDVVTLVTHSEGLPLVLLEAMARGKPVVATAVGGIPEIIRDGETGLLHQHMDEQGLYVALASLLTDQVLAQRLGASGAKFVQENFSVERFASDLTGLYEDLLDQQA
jgi:glycosyltransferase involved in cell wall biosynthesis